MQKVKFIGRIGFDGDLTTWRRQLADGAHAGDLEFTFDFNAQSYDWLVVYDDLPRHLNKKREYVSEMLQCPQENTILITAEPSSVRRYPRLFLDQFNYVLSSQEPEFIRHSGQIYTQCGLRWYYGMGSRAMRTWAEMAANPPLAKSRDVSAIISSKGQRHTLHAQRVAFIEALGREMPELDRFGHGVIALDDKAEAIDPYRYHIAIENHKSLHNWTEKVSDTFLGGALLLYSGAPNLADYIPAESFVTLDLKDPKGSAELIRSLIAASEWDKRRDAIFEARRLMLERYGLFQNLERIIRTTIPSRRGRHFTHATPVIASAYDARMRRPVRSFLEKIRAASRFLPLR